MTWWEAAQTKSQCDKGLHIRPHFANQPNPPPLTKCFHTVGATFARFHLPTNPIQPQQFNRRGGFYIRPHIANIRPHFVNQPIKPQQFNRRAYSISARILPTNQSNRNNSIAGEDTILPNLTKYSHIVSRLCRAYSISARSLPTALLTRNIVGRVACSRRNLNHHQQNIRQHINTD